MNIGLISFINERYSYYIVDIMERFKWPGKFVNLPGKGIIMGEDPVDEDAVDKAIERRST